ncbi:hypothetical protein ACOLNO_003774 [Vibrio parahaemolyticus]
MKHENKEIKFQQEDLKFINEKKEISVDDLIDGIEFENQQIKFESKLKTERKTFKLR